MLSKFGLILVLFSLTMIILMDINEEGMAIYPLIILFIGGIAYILGDEIHE